MKAVPVFIALLYDAHGVYAFRAFSTDEKAHEWGKKTGTEDDTYDVHDLVIDEPDYGHKALN